MDNVISLVKNPNEATIKHVKALLSRLESGVLTELVIVEASDDEYEVVCFGIENHFAQIGMMHIVIKFSILKNVIF